MNRLRPLLLLALLGTTACEFPGDKQGSPYNPPDPALAVSRDWIVQATNTSAGLTAWRRDTMDRRAFSVFPGGCGMSDKRIYFDANTERWLAVGNSNEEDDPTLCLSVSQTNDPTLGWWQYRLPIDAHPDHPTAGWSDIQVVITAAFDRGVKSYVLDKAALLRGQVASYAWFRHADGQAHAVHHPYGTGSHTFVVEAGSDATGRLTFSSLRVWRFDGGVPKITAKTAKVDVGTFGAGGPYSEGPATCQVLNNLYDAVTSNDLQRLYVAVDDGPGASIRVLELHGLLGQWPPWRDSSTLFHVAAAAYYFGSLGVDRDDRIWVGGNCSSGAVPLSLCLGVRQAGDNSEQPMAVVKLGSTFYNPGGGTGGTRCGDYTTLALDPNAPAYLYFSGQLAQRRDTWDTWIMEIGATCTLNPRRCA